jgi:hypothetical protein
VDVILSYFDQNQNVSTNVSKNSNTKVDENPSGVNGEVPFVRTNGRTDITKLTGVLSTSFVKAPKILRNCIEIQK